jgi:hypothetical protein
MGHFWVELVGFIMWVYIPSCNFDGICGLIGSIWRKFYVFL